MSSRRHFLKSAAALGAATLLRPVLGRASTTSGTLLQPAASQRVVFITDIHTRDDIPGIPAFLNSLADRINAMQPDLVLCGGDCIEGGLSLTESQASGRWSVFQQFRQKLNAPFSTVPGNHDLVGIVPPGTDEKTNGPLAAFQRQFKIQTPYRSFDQGGWHFVLLNSIQALPDRSNYRSYIDAAQLAWLTNDLAKVPATTPIVLVTHVPLEPNFSSFVEGRLNAMRSNLVVENSSELLQAFAGKNLRLILQGHLHVNTQTQAGTQDYIMGGAVCGEWWQGSNFGTPNGFGLLALGSNDNGWQYFDCPWSPKSAVASTMAL